VKGIPNQGMYGATKAGVRSLVRTWAQELKDKGIRVNTLSPGATETPIIRGQFDSDEASDAAKQVFASMTPLGRIGQPEELAAAALFLASNESSYVTGIDSWSTAAWPRSEQDLSAPPETRPALQWRSRGAGWVCHRGFSSPGRQQKS
jgi:NAD(P)-dependent dehydrogenase (short-subunit alcohol dehydrogenase family)